MSRRKHALAPCHVTTIKSNSVRKIQRELGAAILAFMSNTVDMIRVGKDFSQLVRADKLSRLDIQQNF